MLGSALAVLTFARGSVRNEDPEPWCLKYITDTG